MRALYVSHNGMAENLGQAQVLPYLRGLARHGVEIDLVSFELPTLSFEAREELGAGLAGDGISWHPLVRTLGGSLPVKLREATRGVGLALRRAIARRPHIVHGRSYLPTAVCDLVAQASLRSKLLFDCRGMIGDEYVDCGYWTTDRLEYRLVKSYEQRLFRRSDGIVVLTRALARWLTENRKVGRRPALEVIPCCVDRTKFRPSEDARRRVRQELGLEESFVVVYSGSLGTWYREEDMARFATALRARLEGAGRRVVFLCLTGSDVSPLRTNLSESGFPAADVIVRKVPPPEMPDYLSAGDLGLSFIQSCFSKKGSSPTKVAEYLACGMIAIVNGDIGDQVDLASEKDACVVLDGFSPSQIDDAVTRAIALTERPREERLRSTLDAARRHFDLEEVGVARYVALYESIVRGRRS